MTTIIPHSELLRRAVAYVDETKQASPHLSISHIIEQASMRFNLSPLETESLLRLFAPEQTPAQPE